MFNGTGDRFIVQYSHLSAHRVTLMLISYRRYNGNCDQDEDHSVCKGTTFSPFISKNDYLFKKIKELFGNIEKMMYICTKTLKV